MTDLKQVAERLRKVQNREMIGDVYGVEGASGTNYRFIEAALDVLISKDMGVACEDWLAERDATLLTITLLEAMGSSRDYSQPIHNYPLWSEDGERVIRVISHWERWKVSGYETPISTVGELRTLARLAGVELKK